MTVNIIIVIIIISPIVCSTPTRPLLSARPRSIHARRMFARRTLIAVHLFAVSARIPHRTPL